MPWEISCKNCQLEINKTSVPQMIPLPQCLPRSMRSSRNILNSQGMLKSFKKLVKSNGKSISPKKFLTYIYAIRSLLEAGGVDRLMLITRHRQRFSSRVVKFASQVLYSMWVHQELREVYRKAGWKETDFVTKTIAGTVYLFSRKK